MALVQTSPTTLAEYRHPNLGVLCTPKRCYSARLTEGWPWAADNGAYSKWDEGRYRAMLDSITGRPGCLFVTAPDVVADWKATLARFETWAPDLAARKLPIAYVLQDGQPASLVPWDQIAAVFVGGTTDYKYGGEVWRLVGEARRRGLHAHMGRVNSHQRLKYAKAIGCHSFDGTQLSWFRDRWLREFLDHAAADRQLLLGEVSP